jgi:GPH family glycoside/pentoside/hexuronide:cation symporter
MTPLNYCFGPCVDAAHGWPFLTDAKIAALLDFLRPRCDSIRTFSCSDAMANASRLAKDRGFHTVVGAWLGRNAKQNERELEALIDQAKRGYVDIAVVGGEVLARKDMSVAKLIGYIDRFRAACPFATVAYNDQWNVLVRSGNLAVLRAVNVVFANCYPHYEGVRVEDARVCLSSAYGRVRGATPSIVDVQIGETGWPTVGPANGAAVPSVDNARLYYGMVKSWGYARAFWFEAFDEVNKGSDVERSLGRWRMENGNLVEKYAPKEGMMGAFE